MLGTTLVSLLHMNEIFTQTSYYIQQNIYDICSSVKPMKEAKVIEWSLAWTIDKQNSLVNCKVTGDHLDTVTTCLQCSSVRLLAWSPWSQHCQCHPLVANVSDYFLRTWVSNHPLRLLNNRFSFHHSSSDSVVWLCQNNAKVSVKIWHWIEYKDRIDIIQYCSGVCLKTVLHACVSNP